MNRKKQIWYISKYFGPRTETTDGGRGYLLLKEIAKQGVGVTVITSDSSDLVDLPVLKEREFHQYIDGLSIIWLRTLKYRVAKSVKRILSWFHFEWRLLRLNKKKLPTPDAIIVSSLSLLTILNGLLLKKKYRCKLIFEIRDIWPLTLTEEGGFSEKNIAIRFFGWIEKLGYTHSDIVVGTMPNLTEHVTSILGYKKEACCIPMGTTGKINVVPTLSEDVIERYIPEDKFIVLYAGTIGITNALEVFFESAKQLYENREIHFVLLGDGSLKKMFQEKYAKYDNVSFMPKVNRNQVQDVLAHADLLYFSVFPSKVWDYGQSLNKVIDYMLSGKPVLASYDGYPSMINEAESGYFIPAGDVEKLVEKILSLSKMPKAQLLEMGKRGQDWLLQYRNYEVLAKEYLEIIFGEQDA